MKEKQKTNRVLTIVLILGTVTVFFPLYMAAIIAFKKPSEMTNDVAGALSFPKQWSFENFRQAMEVTDFWRSLGNSLLITLVTIVPAILPEIMSCALTTRPLFLESGVKAVTEPVRSDFLTAP